MVLVSPSEVVALKKDRTRLPALLARTKVKLDYQPSPSEIFNPDPHYTKDGENTSANNGKNLASDAGVAYRAAANYLVSGDERFATCAQRILDAWATTLKKVPTPQGGASINFNLPYMIIAASWVRDAARWDHTKFDHFLMTTILPVSTSGHRNNHGLWGVFLEASIGAYLSDKKLLGAARQRWTVLMSQSVNAEGIFPNEIQRSDTSDFTGGPTKGIKGLAYTHYAMLPASLAAKIFADEGQPVWETSEGKLLKAAFARAAAWTLHPETFPYYKSNGGKLDGVNNAAYFALLLKVYPNNKDAEAILKSGKASMNGFLLMELFG